MNCSDMKKRCSGSCHLREIKGLQDDGLCAWLDLYELSFPPSQRILVSNILRGVREFDDAARHAEHQKPGEYLLAADEIGQVIGMAQWGFYQRFSTAYLGYFAIAPEMRCQGLGVQVYHLLLDRMAGYGLDMLLFDVEKPELATGGSKDARRRIAFYQRQGARMLEGITFKWPYPPMEQFMIYQPLLEIPMAEVLWRVQGVVNEMGGELVEDHCGY